MRPIKSDIHDGVAEIQEYLYPDNIIRSKKYVIFPLNGFLWLGKVFRTKWRGPRDNFNEILSRFDEFIVKKICISTTVYNMHECMLFDPYQGSQSAYSFTSYSVIRIPIHQQYKFVVHWPSDYAEPEDSLIMHAGTLGVTRVVESLEYFRNRKFK